MAKPIRGTKEWAVAAVDSCIGCSNRCRYCYGRYKQVKKLGLLSADQWDRSREVVELVEKDQPLYPGQVMFPANHDILPENIESCEKVLLKLLQAGNRVLIVSKPRVDVIARLCDTLSSYFEEILFRFTITARDPELLSYWEPGAPHYTERLDALKYASKRGCSTSVSIEPILDVADLESMIREIAPLVSHSIWVGKMNDIENRVVIKTEADRKAVEQIKTAQTNKAIRKLYKSLEAHPLIRWKESIKEVIGLQLANRPGLDI